VLAVTIYNIKKSYRLLAWERAVQISSFEKTTQLRNTQLAPQRASFFISSKTPLSPTPHLTAFLVSFVPLWFSPSALCLLPYARVSLCDRHQINKTVVADQMGEGG